MNIESVINQHHEAIQLLLHRRRIVGPVNMDTIQQAHNRHGEHFMMDLLKIITPGNTSNFTNFGDMLNPGGVIDQAARYNNPAYQRTAAPGGKGKFWNFWDNLLNRVESTGKTIGQFKTDANGNIVPASNVPTAPNVSPKTIYIVAGILIVVIVAIVIIKKKS